MTRLLPATTFCLSALCGTAFAQTIDTPPTTPGNPTARAYGPTAGGVAWQRSSDDRRVVGYEITRDGTVLGVRDTLSYVANDLEPGRGYNFAIVAIDSAGQRSGRALAHIETPDARPNRPTGLAANVYSATAAGITWDRSGVFGERYEVKRDGEIVAAATNGTSYIDTTLSARRPYLFEIIAVNRQGQRSTAARLFVRTAIGSTPPPVEEPPAPANLRSEVYSQTAGELFWDRAATPGLRYEVKRDGDVVSTTNGTSFYDDTLSRGTTYAYEVTAVDGDRRSGTSTVSLTTLGARTSSPASDSISVENRETTLANVIEIVNGTRFFDLRSLAASPEAAGELTLIGTGGDPENAIDVRLFECGDGGTLEITSAGGGLNAESTRLFTRCELGDVVLDGEAQEDNRSTELNSFSANYADGRTETITARWFISASAFEFDRRLSVSRFEARQGERTTIVDGVSTNVRSVNEGRAPNRVTNFAQASVTSIFAPWTQGAVLSVETTERFEQLVNESEFYTSGVLLVRNDVGESLTVDAANGDPGSFLLTVAANGGVSAFSTAWEEDLLIPCANDSSSLPTERRLCELDLGGSIP